MNLEKTTTQSYIQIGSNEKDAMDTCGSYSIFRSLSWCKILQDLENKNNNKQLCATMQICLCM